MGFFTESRILGMLEASECDAVDMVSPFMEAILDMCSGTSNNSLVTLCYKVYVDMTDFIFRRHRTLGWTDSEFQELSDIISQFKNVCRETFENYQHSRMGTTKWYGLDHLAQDLREVGGIKYLHGGLYEKSHKLFKEDFK